MSSLISFDVSSVSTGWAFFLRGKLKEIGTITPLDSYTLQEKLYWFRGEVRSLFKIYKPTNVVIEETYLKNVKTLKVLMQFIGVLNLECFTEVGIEPSFVSPGTVRSYFGVKDKEEAFDYAKNKYKIKLKKFKFEDGNDLSDALLQGLYWWSVLIEKGECNECK